MIGKFKDLLSRTDKGLLDDRVDIMTEEALFAQDNLIRSIENDIRDNKKYLIKLEDLGLTDSASLKPKSFNPISWVRDVQQAKVNLKLLAEALEIAKETKEEYFFGDVEED